METGKVKVEGTNVVIKADSEDTARKLAAAAESEVLREEGGLENVIDRAIDGTGRVVDTLGRPTFNWIAWALAFVGMVVAYISWSRLLPEENIQWLFGIVGVAIILGVKIAAQRAAQAENEGQSKEVSFYWTIAIIGLVINMAAAAAFQAAMSADEESGNMDIGRQISVLESEVRDLNNAATDMQAPRRPLSVLELDLQRALSEEARNNSGELTRLSVREVIGWGSDDYCMPGGQYASYIERYCPDVTDLHTEVELRREYEATIAKRDAKSAEITALEEKRPKHSSGLALGEQLGGAPWYKFLPGVILMLIVEAAMVGAAYTAKRYPKGVRKEDV